MEEIRGRYGPCAHPLHFFHDTHAIADSPVLQIAGTNQILDGLILIGPCIFCCFFIRLLINLHHILRHILKFLKKLLIPWKLACMIHEAQGHGIPEIISAACGGYKII